jgi:hypothetical protein
MLEDTTPPDWVRVRYRSYVRSCVVILAPGLYPEIFGIDPTNGSEGRRMRYLQDITPPCLSNLAAIFKYVWVSRTPGTKTQIHSPTSSFLNCPLSKAQLAQRHRELARKNKEFMRNGIILLNFLNLTYV